MAAYTLQELEIRLKANVKDLKSGLADANADFKKMSQAIQKSVDDLNNTMQLKVAKGMSGAFSPVIQQAKELRDELKKLAASNNVAPAQAARVQRSAGSLVNDVSGVAKREVLKANIEQVNQLTHAQQKQFILDNQFNSNYKTQIAAIKEVTAAQQGLHSEWISGRYALYDVSGALQNASQNLIGFAKSAYEAQFAQQQAFSQVERVTIGTDPNQLKKLKSELIDLTKQIPKSFDEISKIAMLGSQLGISASNLGKFTDTVAKFSTITGVSAEQTATSFGKLANLLKLSADQYDNLGSSIAYVGVNAAATETDILSSSKQIASVGTAAGFTASEVVGLASAMSSLGTSPEEARGVLIPTFKAMDDAVRSFNATTGTGNEALRVFSTTAGMSAKDFADAWGNKALGKSSQAFKAFIAGLGKGDISRTLNQLGLDGVRTSKGLTALGSTAQTVFQQMDNAATGMKLGDYLDKSFAKTIDDVAVKLQLLAASVQELFAGMASNEGVLTVIGMGIDALKNSIGALADATSGPFASAISGIVLSLTALIGAVLGIGAAVALGVASLYAFRVAFNALSKDAIFANSAMMGFIGQILRVPAAAGASTAAVTALGVAAKVAAIGLPALLLAGIAIDAVMSSISSSTESAASNTEKYFGDISGLRDAMISDTVSGGAAIATFTASTASMTDEQKNAQTTAKNLTKVLGELGDTAVASGEKASSSALKFGDASLAYTKAQLSAGKGFKKAVASQTFTNYFVAIGADVDKAIAIGTKKGEAGVNEYFDTLTKKALDKGKKLSGIELLGKGWGRTEHLSSKLNPFIKALGGLKASSQQAANATKILGISTDNTASSESALTQEILDKNKASYAEVDANIAIQESLINLAGSLKKSKTEFTATTENGRSNIKALEGTISSYVTALASDPQLLSDTLLGLKNSLVDAGVKGVEAFNLIDAAIANTGKVATGGIKIDLNKLFKTATTSTGVAKTALQKLQEATDKLFKSTRNLTSVYDSVRTLGSSLSTSKDWSKYTENGSTNIKNLLGLIDDIVVKSNGNRKKAANDLMSLRAALIQTGQGSKTALSLISQELNVIGGSAKKNARAISKDVKQMVANIKAGIASGTDSQIVTLSQYASDLKNILSSAFDIRYGSTSALDSITSAWQDLASSAEDAAQAVKDANAELTGLKADKTTLEYQLGVATQYGNTVRIAQITAELAKVDASISEKQKNIAELNATNDKTLTGDSKAAIQNRATVRGMVSQYTEYLTSLANAGMSSDDLKKKAGELAADFLAQGKSLGFSADELQKYTDAFTGDFSTAIDGLPTKVTVTVDSDPAIRAIREFVASANGELSKINGIQINATTIPVAGQLPQYATGGLITGAGTGTSDSVPILASNGEFVMSSAAVQSYGVDFMNSLNQARVTVPSYNAPAISASSSGSGIVYLSPEDRNLLRAAIDRPINLYTENQRIAASANAGNVILAQRGSK